MFPLLSQPSGAAKEGNRVAHTETVTVLFTDLVGSTDLAERLGHTAYEALRSGHFTTLRTALNAATVVAWHRRCRGTSGHRQHMRSGRLDVERLSRAGSF